MKVAGCPIHYQYRGSGEKHRQGLIFIHGNGAHSRWWDHIAPAFTSDYQTVAVDLSGSGDSGHREIYTPQTFAREILEVATHAGMEKPLLVGHSFGGSMARIAAWLHQDRIAGLVLIDSVISDHRGKRRDIRRPTSRVRYYASAEEAMLRFRLRPPQPCENKFIIRHIARHSVRLDENGWRFKADQSLFSKMTADDKASESQKPFNFPDAVTMINDIHAPVGLIYGAKSRFFSEESIKLAQATFPDDLLHQISDAYHHLLLDQPLHFIETLHLQLKRILAAT